MKNSTKESREKASSEAEAKEKPSNVFRAASGPRSGSGPGQSSAPMFQSVPPLCLFELQRVVDFMYFVFFAFVTLFLVQYK